MILFIFGTFGRKETRGVSKEIKSTMHKQKAKCFRKLLQSIRKKWFRKLYETFWQSWKCNFSSRSFIALTQSIILRNWYYQLLIKKDKKEKGMLQSKKLHHWFHILLSSESKEYQIVCRFMLDPRNQGYLADVALRFPLMEHLVGSQCSRMIGLQKKPSQSVQKHEEYQSTKWDFCLYLNLTSYILQRH